MLKLSEGLATATLQCLRPTTCILVFIISVWFVHQLFSNVFIQFYHWVQKGVSLVFADTVEQVQLSLSAQL